MASIILGDQGAGNTADHHIVAKEAIDEILRYYHYKPVEVPENITDREEQMEYCLRPHGLMRRNAYLPDGWYKDAFGPMLGFRKEDNMAVALLPKPFMGYWIKDPVTGKKVTVNKKTAELFRREAVCFYRPLPLKKLGIRDLLLYMKDCLRLNDFLLILVLSFLAVRFGMFFTGITRILTGIVVQQKDVSLLMGTSVFLISVVISEKMINIVKDLMMNRIEVKTSLCVEAAVMMRLMNLPAAFFRRFSSGELSSRFSAVSQLCSLLLGQFLSTGLGSIASLLYITQIFEYTSALVVPALCVILVTVGLSVVTTILQMNISKQMMEYGAKNSGISYALIMGVQKIKLAGAEKRAFSRWAQAYSKTAALQYDPPMILKINGTINMAVSLAGTIILYYVAVQSRISVPDYMGFNIAYGAVLGAFSSLAGIALSAAQIKPILDMAKPILETEPECAENKAMVTSLSGGIELSNVYFRYTDQSPNVVDGMSLKIRPGEYVAIVGPTGCGKSTLMRLLLGFETPQKGAIYYDGKDISKLDLRSLRRRIGAVTQDGSLFQGDIYSNIVISAPQLTLEEAWEAARIAGIEKDIRAMPMGMHTVISEGQGGISGGQKQRLMIARAVAPRPKILMLDEATSALDNKTQKEVADALDKLKCTRIVIAHRLSTIKNCDRILVLDKGHVIEDGTYDQLIARNGYFAELVARQRLDVKQEA